VLRLTPKGMVGVKECLAGYPEDMRVEVGPGVLLDANTVADLRSLWGWPLGLVLIVNQDPDQRFSVVKVERRPGS